MTAIAPTMESYRAQAQRHGLLFVLGLAALTTLTGLWLLSVDGNAATLAWLVFLIHAAVIFYNPRYGLYTTLWLTLSCDFTLTRWDPFTTNFSSEWSIFYLGGWAVFSPLELSLVLVVVSWLLRAAGRRRLNFVPGALALPMLLFVIVLAFGLVYGIGTGGSINIALWESRYIFYLPLVYFLVCNVLDDRRQVNNLMWLVATALFYEGIWGVVYVAGELGWDLSLVQSITEHSAAIHMNTLFILVAVTLLYGGSWARKLALPAMAPVVFFTYIATQRRAAFVTLAVGLMLVAVVMYRTHRRLFWTIVPALSVVGMLYLGAFWNNTGALGMPAQAIKSATVGSAEEAHSDDYRKMENVNSNFTIHQKPLTGVGFGNKFFVLIVLPDISFFPMWEYIPHNSVIWMWIKTGVVGFVVYLFMVGASIVKGAQVFNVLNDNTYRPLILAWTIYWVMHFVYAYVDMSWDSQSTVYLGMTAGVIGHMENLLARPLPPEPASPYWGTGHALGEI